MPSEERYMPRSTKTRNVEIIYAGEQIRTRGLEFVGLTSRNSSPFLLGYSRMLKSSKCLSVQVICYCITYTDYPSVCLSVCLLVVSHKTL